MVPIPGTLHPRVTPSPLEKIRPAGPLLLPRRAQPPGRGGCRCRPDPPVENRRPGPWPPRHPAHPGQTPDAASDGTHPGDPASPLDPLAAGRKTPPDKHRLQHASQCEIHTEGDTGRPDGAAAEGSGRPGQTEDGESDGAHRGEPAPSDDPVLAGNSPASGPPAPSPAVGRSDGQNLLPTPGWVSGGVGSACGALSARCVEICRSESSADARVGEREGRLGMRGAVGPLRRDLPVTISRHLLRG
ncbi:collagen alpha-1(I) chain-like [Lytechinus pictus]|uniref:collagen alpha-1(I) chain-like n=1 Tax=Lytechinus pictus TaxID=7653 RepID=UPI0030BA282E